MERRIIAKPASLSLSFPNFAKIILNPKPNPKSIGKVPKKKKNILNAPNAGEPVAKAMTNAGYKIPQGKNPVNIPNINPIAKRELGLLFSLNFKSLDPTFENTFEKNLFWVQSF